MTSSPSRPLDELQIASIEVLHVRAGHGDRRVDRVAVERPLAVKTRADGEDVLISTTMRTPGCDEELAAGFLLAERVLEAAGELADCRRVDADTVMVELAPSASARVAAATRRFITSSACGVCGREEVASLYPAPLSPSGERDGRPRQMLSFESLRHLPARLREAQAVFAETGGLHAAGLFDAEGRLTSLREDVGRHNAVDKVIGAHVLAGRIDLSDFLLMVSGRASFELAQKAAVARIPCLVAVGAPSSLAVEVAAASDMTLVGFAREDRFNVYHQGERAIFVGGERAR